MHTGAGENGGRNTDSGKFAMTERLKIQTQQDTDLKKELEKVDFNLDYGSVKIQIRNGKPSLITIERTVKLD